MRNATSDKLPAREKCQVFTPGELVESMLDLAGYTSDIVGKRILENSFGSGAFLTAIADIYVAPFAKT